MNDYFTEERVENLKKVCNEWVGTPFRSKCCVKGLGTDCIHFVLGVFDEIGMIDKRKIRVPDYEKDWNKWQRNHLLMDGLYRYLNVREVKLPYFKNIPKEDEVDGIINLLKLDLKDGDLIVWWFGKNDAHAGIWCDGCVYHSVDDRARFGVGVIKLTLQDAINFKKNNGIMSRILRVIE